jgi:hypothetical protein
MKHAQRTEKYIRLIFNCHLLWHCWTLLSLWGFVENTVVTYDTSKSADNPLFFGIFKIDQIINDHEWTTNNALLFSDEIASKPCNHNV